MMLMERRCIRGFRLALVTVVTVFGITLTSRRWSMKENGVKESDGAEVFNMTATATPCLVENG